MKKAHPLLVASVLGLGVTASFFFLRAHNSQIRGGGPELRQVPEGMRQYGETVKNLNDGWDNVGIGNSYYQTGQYEDAVSAYKKAYDVDPGNRIFIGLKLIETYEHLSRYDEALSVLDELSNTPPISDYGMKKYTDIRSRLLAAKAQQTGRSPEGKH